jgi:VWFA-related protein
MARKILPVTTLFCGLLFTSSPVAQETPPPLPETLPALGATTRMVEVSVIVEDAKGEPVAGLARDDFSVFDGGLEQEISAFAVESLRPLADQSHPLGPRTFSNRVEYRAGTPTSATIILLDGLNTRFADQVYAKGQVLKFLQQLEPRERIALYALSRGPHVLQDFTDNPTALRSAMARFKTGAPLELAASETSDATGGLQGLDAWLGEIRENLFDVYTKDRALRTVRSLVAIANHVARLPGRKNLVWISGSFPFRIGLNRFPGPEESARDPRSFLPEIERAARALNDANLAVYPVDARGLLTPPEFAPDRETVRRELRGVGRREIGTMNVLAERTGGLAFYNTNDVYGAVRRAVDDMRLSYVLSYYPTHGKWDGKFREIKVHVKRAGLRVRHRRGYFALAEKSLDPRERQAVLDAAMWSPMDSTHLGMTVHVRAVPAPGPPVLDLELELDPHDVTLQHHEGNWAGALDLLLVQLSTENRNLKSVSHVASLRLTEEDYRQARKRNTLSLTARVEVASGASLLRVLVRDIPSGTLGSLTIPLKQVLPGRFK